MSMLGIALVLLMGVVIVTASITILYEFIQNRLERLRPRYRTVELCLLRGSLWKMPRRGPCQA